MTNIKEKAYTKNDIDNVYHLGWGQGFFTACMVISIVLAIIKILQ